MFLMSIKQFNSIVFFAIFLLYQITLSHQVVYVSPKPGAQYVSRYSNIIIRADFLLYEENLELSSLFKVTGEKSGDIDGYITIAPDKSSIIFHPDNPFLANEEILVELNPLFYPHFVDLNKPFRFGFKTCLDESEEPLQLAKATIVEREKTSQKLQSTTAQIMSNGVSVPSDFPHIQVDINTQPAEGYMFLNNWGGQPYNIIFDNDGSPIWYLRTTDRRRDFKVQKNGHLTMLVRSGYDFGQGFIELDSTYSEIKSYDAVNGYSTDEHELQVLENGNYLLVGIRSVRMDMSKIMEGGSPNANVNETTMQEFTPDGSLVLNWPALEHFDPRDMVGFSPDDQPTDQNFRFPHMNSIDIDDDGHIILSSKRLSEITKINRQTGEIIWRLGGANNQFEFVNDPLGGFFAQHDARALGNGHYTLFDNGCMHNPPVSRAVEYVLDTEKKTATLVWQYMENPPTYSVNMGNVQRLPNGNTYINWAQGFLPKATEVTPDGEKVYEMNFVEKMNSYRTFRFPWNGIATKPTLYIEPGIDDLTFIFNKFGDPNVEYYKIYADKRSNPTTVVDTSKATLKKLSNFENNRYYWFRVTAVDKNGNESDYSNEERVQIQFSQPRQNMVVNESFDNGKDSWIFELQGTGVADWEIVDGECHFIIQNGGGDEHDVQIRQEGFALSRGRHYLFEFDAWADQTRTIEAKVGQNYSPFTNYSKIGLTLLSAKKQRFSYGFTMEDQTDHNARIVFNVGNFDIDVYVDNISLRWVDETQVSTKTGDYPDTFSLLDNYPNPFNAQTTISFFLLHKSNISINIYNILGHLVKSVEKGECSEGVHTVNIDGNELSSGVYLYQLVARQENSHKLFSDIRKMTLVK